MREHACPRCETELVWHGDDWGYRCPRCYTFVCIPRKPQPPVTGGSVMSLRDEIAEALQAELQWDWEGEEHGTCSRGAPLGAPSGAETIDDLAERVEARILQRHTVIELPEAENGVWAVEDTDIEVRFAGGSPPAIEFRVESVRGGTLAKLYDVTVGPDFAAALVAAARAGDR